MLRNVNIFFSYYNPASLILSMKININKQITEYSYKVTLYILSIISKKNRVKLLLISRSQLVRHKPERFLNFRFVRFFKRKTFDIFCYKINLLSKNCRKQYFHFVEKKLLSISKTSGTDDYIKCLTCFSSISKID